MTHLQYAWKSTCNQAHKINSLHVVPAKMSRYVYVVIPLNHCMLGFYMPSPGGLTHGLLNFSLDILWAGTDHASLAFIFN